MKEIKGNIFEQHDADAICVTTCGVVKSNGELVMGAGIAKQFADRFPGLSDHLGKMVRTRMVQGRRNVPHIAFYGPRWLTNGDTGESYLNPNYKVIISFPTKHHWKDSSSLELIHNSAWILADITREQKFTKVVLPRPGCGLGGLKWEDVKKVLEPILDDRFFVITPN